MRASLPCASKICLLLMRLSRLVCIVCHPFFTIFLVSLTFVACPIRGWALLDGGFCFFFSPPFFLLLPPAIPLNCSCCKVVLLQTGWASFGLLFILPLMAQQDYWFLCYIVSGLPYSICFPLGFLGPFPIFALPWTFTEFFGLPWPNYIIPHPWGS